MGIFRNILLTVGLLWVLLFRVYPMVAGTVSPAHGIAPTVVKQNTHSNTPSTDSAVYWVQDEDEQLVPSPNPEFLSEWPTEWLSLLLVALLLLPVRLALAGKPVNTHRPYYLLYCSLRIPAV
ncbi:hypothetical protein GCM10027299_47320 [Larkinella ripae]